jgi:hypothetical protein
MTKVKHDEQRGCGWLDVLWRSEARSDAAPRRVGKARWVGRGEMKREEKRDVGDLLR